MAAASSLVGLLVGWLSCAALSSASAPHLCPATFNASVQPISMTDLYWEGEVFNTDIDQASQHSLYLQRFADDENLCHTGLHNNGDFTFENSLGHRSNIDHFFVNDVLIDGDACCTILNETANFSDQAALSLTLTLCVEKNAPAAHIAQTQLRWEEATEVYIKQPTGTSLLVLETIPLLYREAALVWKATWQQCGRPATDPVACIRRRTRALYHQDIKWVKNSDDLQSDRMVNALSANRSRDMWKEVKRKRIPIAPHSPSRLPQTLLVTYCQNIYL
ncbi:hypothetical protein CAPTEDRAFT_184901 [Capitella teleta]|uniref:Uncharacterized protein n=1 Tax=Capitella teleta TaxID=283909 RepID=X1ZH80_CAPTE|nr:hypothetical protein CAPTEDRAFT_184901 [Capitella teleta]|eukprot:ELT90117.1 hypothetical protein CAPTEDRAFT_184901 [Capitella teleta]